MSTSATKFAKYLLAETLDSEQHAQEVIWAAHEQVMTALRAHVDMLACAVQGVHAADREARAWWHRKLRSVLQEARNGDLSFEHAQNRLRTLRNILYEEAQEVEASATHD